MQEMMQQVAQQVPVRPFSQDQNQYHSSRVPANITANTADMAEEDGSVESDFGYGNLKDDRNFS